MSAEKILGQLESLTKEQPHNPLRPSQIEDLMEEKDRLEATVLAPKWVPGNRALAQQSLKRVNKTLKEQAPKEITDAARRDKVVKAAQAVVAQIIQPSMQSDVIMRRNPAGAIGKYQRGEGSPFVKRAILAVRRAMRAVNPMERDPDYTNMEQYRPSVTGQGTSTFMADAQVPGVFGMTPAAKENWPLGEPTSDTALKQVVRRAKGATPNQIAALQRARAAKADKKQAAAEANTSEESSN